MSNMINQEKAIEDLTSKVEHAEHILRRMGHHEDLTKNKHKHINHKEIFEFEVPDNKCYGG